MTTDKNGFNKTQHNENHVKTIEKRVFGNKADEDDQQMLFNL